MATNAKLSHPYSRWRATGLRISAALFLISLSVACRTTTEGTRQSPEGQSPEARAAAHSEAMAASHPAADRVVISLQDINCQSCGVASANVLKNQPGVLDVDFNRDQAELTVFYDQDVVDSSAMTQAISALGYGAVVGAGQGRYQADIKFEPAMDVAWLSEHGEDVEIESGLVPGKFTVVDFYASWCGPCREVDRALYELLLTRDDIALRKINVADWNSPIAKHYMASVPQLPYVLVFGPDGKRIDTISGLDLKRLLAALKKDAPA